MEREPPTSPYGSVRFKRASWSMASRLTVLIIITLPGGNLSIGIAISTMVVGLGPCIVP
ncbi:hypothetical protein KI387_009496, partial [Taxus chinensis]